MKRNLLLIFFILFFIRGFSLYSQSQGEVLFKENKPKDAVKVLENEILNGIVSANTYNFLGLGYYQIGEYAKSIDAFNRGIKEQPSIAKLLTYNQGNTYYAMKDYTSAVRCYTEVINEDGEFFDAILNRANALLMANQLTVARDEYIGYLEKCPEDKQRPQIEELIKALEAEIARREEEARLLAEQEKARWEEYDASFEEMVEDELLAEWEKVDASIPEEKKPEVAEGETQNDEPKTDWESVEAKIPEEEKTPEVKPDWEKVDTRISEEKKEDPKTDWEKVLFEKELAQNPVDKKDEELVLDDSEFQKWQDLSLEDVDEMRELELRSKEEREQWIAEQERIIRNREKEKQRLENEEKLKLQVQKDREEKELREKVMNEMMRAENERKQKLLDDLANSLMNSESTNMSSGADDIMEYDLEGELD